MSILFTGPKVLADLSLGTVVHIGAGAGDVQETYNALNWKRLVLVEGDAQAVSELQSAAAQSVNVEVRGCAVTRDAGNQVWHRYNLPKLNGPLDAEALRDVYPRLRQLATFPVVGEPLAALLSDVLSPDDCANVLVMDVAGQEDALLAGVPSDLLRRFDWVLLNGCRHSTGGAWCNPDAAVERLRGEGFSTVPDENPDAGLWTSQWMRFDPQAYELNRLRADLAAATDQLDSQRVAHLAQLQAAQQALFAAQVERDRLASEQAVLVSARDEQTRLASSASDRAAGLVAELSELSARYQMLEVELGKAEAQIELISDLILREPAR